MLWIGSKLFLACAFTCQVTKYYDEWTSGIFPTSNNHRLISFSFLLIYLFIFFGLGVHWCFQGITDLHLVHSSLQFWRWVWFCDVKDLNYTQEVKVILFFSPWVYFIWKTFRGLLIYASFIFIHKSINFSSEENMFPWS